MLSKAANTLIVSYTYDNDGNQLTMEDATGTTSRTYDEFGRVLTKTVPVIDKGKYDTVNYEYDIITGVDEGCTAENSTDPKDNLTTKEYDKNGRLKNVTADGKTTTYNYYDNGSRQSVVYSDGAREDYTYYGNNQLWTLTNKHSNGSVIDTYTYAYDGANNLSSKVDALGTTSYTYDDLERLLTVAEPGRNTAYEYDASGNRTKETVTTGTNTKVTSYDYNDLNRLTNITVILNGASERTVGYKYDFNGNVGTVTTTISGGTAQTNTNYYDAFNRLTKSLTGTGMVENVYDGDGHRVMKKVNGTTATRYLYEYDNVVLETDGAGSQTARNVYGTNLLMRNAGGQSVYYMYNGHADVTALVDVVTKLVADYYYYDAFGNIMDYDASGNKITNVTSNVKNTITYAGYQYDKETGTYYLNARMYDPATARFLQEDTVTGDPNDPLSLNLYTYCHNEPMMYSDPTGHYEYADFLYLPNDALVQIGNYTKDYNGTSYLPGDVPSKYKELSELKANQNADAVRTFYANYYPRDTEEFTEHYKKYESADSDSLQNMGSPVLWIFKRRNKRFEIF